MNKKMVFACEYCGLEFDNEADCEEHEKTHIEDYSESSNNDIAKELNRLSLIAYDYRKELATAIAAMKIKEAVSKLFPEEPQEEKNTERDSKFEDLKNLLFNHASGSSETIPGTDIENNRTAEIRRDAKHEALISLILNAGLTKEYHEWLIENGYE